MGNSKPDPKESELRVERLRAMHRETTDPLAAQLLGDILTEMEAAFASEKDTDDDRTT